MPLLAPAPPTGASRRARPPRGAIRRVCREFVEYYNRARPSHALHGIPDPYPELKNAPQATGEVEARPVLGGLIQDHRRAA
jgi:hypothetical protein